MLNRPAVKEKWLTNVIFYHNCFLSTASFVLLLLFLENIIPKLLARGLYFCCCDASIIEDGHIAFASYFNYLLKYYELLDTLFLVLKKKDLEFLHVYHHALTLMLCQIQLKGHTSIQWIPITLNLFVHVLMYYYYAATSIGKQVWWKKYLTALQIYQFVIDIIFCWGALILLKVFGVFCYGTIWAAWFGSSLLSSYLLLFIDFFFKRYDTTGKKVENKKDK